jgi:hypothetical protein
MSFQKEDLLKEAVMRISTFVASATIFFTLFLLVPTSTTSAPFTPGSNTSIEWIDSNDLLGMLPTNIKPFLVYGYVAGEENYSMGFEWGIFEKKSIVTKSEEFVCIKTNLNDTKTAANLIATLHELSGETLTFPSSTFVMLLKSNGEKVYLLEKTMSPEDFKVYMDNTIKRNKKIVKLGE